MTGHRNTIKFTRKALCAAAQSVRGVPSTQDVNKNGKTALVIAAPELFSHFQVTKQHGSVDPIQSWVIGSRSVNSSQFNKYQNTIASINE